MNDDINERSGCRRVSKTTTENPGTRESDRIPEFTRLPRVGERCLWTGMSRGAINDLILGTNPPVRSVSFCKEGASRGIRLVHLPSLLAYLHDLMAKQQG